MGNHISLLSRRFGFAGMEIGAAAPELGAETRWLNSSPLSLGKLKGKVVLLDFWTYSCIECLRSLPYMARLERLYKSEGFMVIGIHSPEFEFEKETKNLAAEIKRLAVTYPVAMDNDLKIWSDYKSKYWPNRILIDSEGVVRHQFIGHGNYTGIENTIIRLINETGKNLPMKHDSGEVENIAPYGMPRVTPMVYFGKNGYDNFGNYDVDKALQVQNLNYPPEIRNEYYYLSGAWVLEKDRISNPEAGTIMITYNAASVNLVAGPGVNSAASEIDVLLDNSYVKKEDAGDDLILDNNGRSYVKIIENRLYNLINHQYGVNTRTLELAPGSPVSAYAISFEATR